MNLLSINRKANRKAMTSLIASGVLLTASPFFVTSSLRAEEAAKPAAEAAEHDCGKTCKHKDCGCECKSCKMKHGKGKAKGKECKCDCGCKDDKEKSA